MPVEARLNFGRAVALPTARAHSGALWLLAAASAGALLGLPWLSSAANRLVSGQPLWLLPLLCGPHALPVAVVLVTTGILVGLCAFPPCRARLLAMLILVVALIPGLLWLAGAQASAAGQSASPMSRTMLASGFWLAWALLALLLAEVMQRLQLAPVVRALVALSVAVAVGGVLVSSRCDELSLLQEFASRSEVFWSALGRHLLMVTASLGLTLLIGLPLGVWSHYRLVARRLLMPALNVLQTIPSIALFGLLMAPLAWLGTAVPALGRGGLSGVGFAPAVLALTLYALLPVVRGVLTGLAQTPAGVLQAARSLGLSGGQTLRWVALPLALPVLLVGVRTALVQLVGLAAVAALIGAGGLGAILFEGLFSAAQDVVLLAVLPIVALGAAADAVCSAAARMTRMSRVRAVLACAAQT